MSKEVTVTVSIGPHEAKQTRLLLGCRIVVDGVPEAQRMELHGTHAQHATACTACSHLSMERTVDNSNALSTFVWRILARKSNVWLLWLPLYSTSVHAFIIQIITNIVSTKTPGNILHVSSKIAFVVDELRFHVAGKTLGVSLLLRMYLGHKGVDGLYHERALHQKKAEDRRGKGDSARELPRKSDTLLALILIVVVQFASGLSGP